MSIEFVKIKGGECVLCGAFGFPTGEHKIKASLIRQEFGDRKTIFSGKEPPKIAQSSKSKHFHFKNAVVCIECNSSRTQAADRAFDDLHLKLKHRRDKGFDLSSIAVRPKTKIRDLYT